MPVTWVKIDDSFPDHPKITRLSDAAFRAYVTGLCYCGKYLTDGVIPGPLARRFAGKTSVLRELTDSLLWIVLGDDVAVNDYLEYNPTKQAVESERKSARDRRAKSRRTSADASGEIAVGSGDVTANGPGGSPDVPATFISPVPDLVPEELQELPSAAPRDDVPDEDQAFILGRLRGRLEAFDEAELTAGAVAKLNADWTQPIVTGVLRELWGFPPDDVADAYGLLLVMCRDRAKRQATS